MEKSLSLAELTLGINAYITEIQHSKEMTQRLLDLGFTKNTPIRALFRSYSGDPTAFLIRNTVIALRKEDSVKIKISFYRKKS
ncbi:iron transporter FeoA [Clostridia bacterium]|nr:iron transporter FeoA [Clostridia bacterium]